MNNGSHKMFFCFHIISFFHSFHKGFIHSLFAYVVIYTTFNPFIHSFNLICSFCKHFYRCYDNHYFRMWLMGGWCTKISILLH